jgi:hypothetical protein
MDEQTHAHEYPAYLDLEITQQPRDEVSLAVA